VARGGLAEIKALTMRLSELQEKAGRKPLVARALFDRELPLNLRTTPANAYNAPIHNPRTTKVYSVSFPVWGA
jgi:hypothetical protein